MRPIRLTLAGLNSFEGPQTIDFEKLSSKGLFGIFGPTGSGKSTIIDGIVMSLYGPGSIPRGTKDFINTETDQAEVEFVFRTVVEGTLREIEIRRVFKRAKDGYRSHQSRIVLRTLEGETLLIEDKQSEVNRQIEEILGLSDSEFLKMVVLPQGKFSEFIQLDPKDRRNMLQSLFGLELYGDRLLERLKSRMGLLAFESSSLKGQLAAYEDVDAERLRCLKEESASWRQKASQAEQEVRRLKLEYDLVLERFEREKRLKALKEAYVQHRSLASNQAGRCLKLERHKKAAPGSETEKSLRQLQQHLKECFQNAALADKSFSEAEKDYNSHMVAFDTLDQHYGKLPLWRHEAEAIRQQWQMAMALKQLRNEISGLDQMRSEVGGRHQAASEALEKADAAWTACQEMMKQVSQTLERNGMNREEAEVLRSGMNHWQQMKAAKQLLKTLEAQIVESATSKAARDKVVEDKQSALSYQQQSLAAAEYGLEQLQLNREQLRDEGDTLTSNLTAMGTRYEALKLLSMSLESERERLEILHVQKQRQEEALIEKRVMYEAGLAARLRASLSEGDHCPVCGGLYGHQTGQNDSELDAAWIEKFENDERAFAILAHQVAESVKTVAQLSSQLAESGIHDVSDLEREKQRIDQMKQAHESIQSSRKAADNQIENLKITQQEAIKGLEKMRSELEIIRIEAGLEAQSAAALHSRRDMISEGCHLHQQGLLDDMKACNEASFISNLTDERVEAYFQEMNERKKQTEDLETELSHLVERREKHSGERREAMDSVNVNSVELERLNGSHRQMEAERHRLETALGSETDEDALKNKLEDLLERIEVTQRDYPIGKARLNVLNEQLENAKKERLEKEAVLSANQRHLAEIQQAFESKWRSAGFSSEIEWKEALLSEPEAEQLEEAIRAYEAAGVSLREKIEAYNDLAGGEPVTEASALKSEQEYQSAQALWTEAIESRGKTEEASAKMQQDLAVKLEVQKQLSLTEKETGYFELLQKLLRGNRFVEFLAMNQLNHVLVEASGRLMSMTANRYRLEVDSRGNFRIVDHHQGGVSRDLKTLSGGETFMASLALALAMSSRLQLRGKIRLETFLLDEGFGSLDASLLDVVMQSLETLIGDQLSVGLISHVEALKARVPVRLDVTPAEPGVSGTRVEMTVN
jgi:exonuclease SbcC